MTDPFSSIRFPSRRVLIPLIKSKGNWLLYCPHCSKRYPKMVWCKKKNYSLVFRLGCQPSTHKKEEWRNKVVCGLHKFEQGLHQRQLPLTKDGPNAAEGGRRGIVYFHDGWILRIQPGQDAPWRHPQDHFHHSLGYVHLYENAIWSNECRGYFPKIHGLCFFIYLRSVHSDIPRWYDSIFKEDSRLCGSFEVGFWKMRKVCHLIQSQKSFIWEGREGAAGEYCLCQRSKKLS